LRDRWGSPDKGRHHENGIPLTVTAQQNYALPSRPRGSMLSLYLLA
jgi:hypothetical protein